MHVLQALLSRAGNACSVLHRLKQCVLGVLQAAVFTRGQDVRLETTGKAALSDAFQPAFDSASGTSGVPLPRVRAKPPAQQSAHAKALADYASAVGLG
jgi:hypothetical protein